MVRVANVAIFILVHVIEGHMGIFLPAIVGSLNSIK